MWADGVWKAEEGAAMPKNVQKRFFAAMRALAARVLLAKSEFVADVGKFAPNEARFVYRRPALARLDCLDVFLDEQYSGPSFELHFKLLLPSNLLTVAVEISSGEDAQPSIATASWERLFNLPAPSDPSMVDVWHSDNSLAPRIVAETRHRDVFARFRSVTRKKHSRHDSESDGANDQDNDKKGDEHDENAEDDEDEAGHDVDSEAGDELSRRGVSGSKKKRKRAGVNEQAENDESVAPVSPDTHVNSPDASIPTVCMTFPHDAEVELRVAREVQLYKRKRTRSKNKAPNAPNLAVTFGELSAATSSTMNESAKRPWMPQDLLGHHLTSNASRRPGSLPVKTEPKPTLSVAVSLVESLSHNEQQEVLDSRPVKTHPLLQALQDYVDNEASEALKQAIERQKYPKVKMIANAAAFLPSPSQAPLVLSAVNHTTTQRLQLRLLSKEFDHWRCGYDSRRGFKKHRRYTSRSNQNRLLLGFSAAKLEEWSYQRAIENSGKDSKDAYVIRDREISVGAEMAGSDAVIEWSKIRSNNYWAVDSGSHTSVASSVDKNVIAGQLQPYLEAISNRIKSVNSPKSPATPTRSKRQSMTKRDGSWMTLESYLRASTVFDTRLDDNDSSKEQIRLLDDLLPALCVATADSSYQIAPPAISEYLLRNFHPVCSSKPADYVVVCPHSPSQWLGSLVLSYLTSFRSVYTRSNMGDLAPVDISGLDGNDEVSVDAPNATLLLECAATANDVFANFRSAGAMLRPLLSAGVKKQAFARIPVGTVVFLVAPFRRSDIKHKLWLLGAFACGLFDWKTLDDAKNSSMKTNTWRSSVTIEILYLDELFATELNPSPHAVMAECFSLFNRVGESVSLTPLASASNGVGDAQARTRYIQERLYTVSDWREHDTKTIPFVHGGYTTSSDGKWLVFSCIDAIGSVCESHVISLVGVDLLSALARMMTSFVGFVTLLGEQAVLVVTRLNVGDNRMDDSELFAWDELRASQWDSILPMDGEAAALATRVTLSVLSGTPRSELEPRDNEASAVVVSSSHGLMVHSPLADSSSSRVTACVDMFGNTSTSWSTSEPENRAPVVLQLTHLRDLSADTEDVAPIESILRDFHALSFLTTNPVTGARESPLPLHLAVVQSKAKQLNMLQSQLAATPLAT